MPFTPNVVAISSIRLLKGDSQGFNRSSTPLVIGAYCPPYE